MNEREGIQDFLPLVHKHVDLQCDHDVDGLDELLSFVLSPIEALWLGSSGSPRQVAPGGMLVRIACTMDNVLKYTESLKDSLSILEKSLYLMG